MTETLDERARRLLAGSAGAPRFGGRRAAPGPELIRYLKNCSVYRRPFVVVAERHGDTLRMVRNEEAPTGTQGGGAVSSFAALGTFRFDGGVWPGCPHCGARANPAHGVGLFWMCVACKARGRAYFNCVGCDRLGRFHCACGAVVTGPFENWTRFEVQGARSTAHPPGVPSIAAVQAARSTAAIAAPRPADTALRLPWKR